MNLAEDRVVVLSWESCSCKMKDTRTSGFGIAAATMHSPQTEEN